MLQIPKIDELKIQNKRFTSVSFSNDDKIAVGCAIDSSGYVYNIDETTLKLTNKENPIIVRSGDEEVTSLCQVVFHPNKKILGICNFGKITLWSYENDEFILLYTITNNKGEGNIASFAFDPSEKNYFAYSRYGKLVRGNSSSPIHYIAILDLTSVYNRTQKNGILLRPIQYIYNNGYIKFDVYNMFFHPSNQILAISQDNLLLLFKVYEVQPFAQTEPIKVFGNHEQNIRITSLAFHNNGNFLASGFNTGIVILYKKSESDDSFDKYTDMLAIKRGEDHSYNVYEITSLAFHPTQLILAAGRSSYIFFWGFDKPKNEILARNIGIIDNYMHNNGISFHRSLPILASASDDSNDGTLLLYDVSGYIQNSTNHSGGRILQNKSRFFKLVSVNGKKVDGGRYELSSKTKSGKAQTRGPKDKASIALSEICKKNNKKGECSYKFSIQETTRESNKKIYNYEGKRVKLEKPIILELKDKKTGVINKVVKKYKNIITAINLDKHH